MVRVCRVTSRGQRRWRDSPILRDLADLLRVLALYQRAYIGRAPGDVGSRYSRKLRDVLDRGLMKDSLRAARPGGSCNFPCNIVTHSRSPVLSCKHDRGLFAARVGLAHFGHDGAAFARMSAM